VLLYLAHGAAAAVVLEALLCLPPLLLLRQP
jgi:hypothetical protein